MLRTCLLIICLSLATHSTLTAATQSDPIVRASIKKAYDHSMAISKALRRYDSDNKLIQRIFLDHSSRMQALLESTYIAHKHLVGTMETENDNNNVRDYLLAKLTLIDREAKQINDLLAEIAPADSSDAATKTITTALVELHTLIQTCETNMGHKLDPTE